MLNKRTLLTVALMGMFAACSRQEPEVALAPSAPTFELKDADGKTIKLAVDGKAVSLPDYKGKVVLLNFWATWCAPCKVEIPWFVEFEKQYKSKGFAVLGVSMDEEGWEIVKPYLAKSDINYRMVVGDDKLAQAFGGVDSLPTSFIIDQKGRIAATHVGLVERADYEGEIRELLRDSIGSAGDRGLTELAAN